MSKGEDLKQLLDKRDVIQKQMDDIFTKYNVGYLDLKSLLPKGIEEWEQLFKQKDDITQDIVKLVN